jgi:hypothetical protein
MKKIIISIFTAIALSGCNDFIDLKPVDFPTEETFYTDVKGLEGAIAVKIDIIIFFIL